MKKLRNLITLGTLLAGLWHTSLHATSTDFTTSTNLPGGNYSSYSNTWHITTPATTAISSSITAVYHGYMSGGGGAYVSVGGTSVFNVGTGGTSPNGSGNTTFSNSGSISNLAADTYDLVHSFACGGPGTGVTLNILTTFSW